MKRFLCYAIFLLMATRLFGICPNSISSSDFSNPEKEVRCFNLIKCEGINIEIYKYNYFYLYPDGRIEIRVVMNQTSQESLFSGYYSINTNNNSISIATEDKKPFFFISPNEYTYCGSNSITIVGTLNNLSFATICTKKSLSAA